MKFTFMALATLLACSATAFAEGGESTTKSVWMHYADAGKWEIWPMFAYADSTFKLNSNPANGPFTKFEAKGMAEQLKVEYGINEMFSAGLILGNVNLRAQPTPEGTGFIPDFNISGMADPLLYFEGRNNMGPGTLLYGLNLTVALGNHTVDAQFNNNASNGGIGANPWVGYQMHLGPGTIVGKLQYSGFLTDRKTVTTATNGTTTTTTTDGGQMTQMDVLWEQNITPTIIYGAGFTYNAFMQTKNTTSGVQTDGDNGTAALGGEAYAVFIIPAPGFEFIAAPLLSYNNAGAGFINHVQSASSMSAVLLTAFVF